MWWKVGSCSELAEAFSFFLFVVCAKQLVSHHWAGAVVESLNPASLHVGSEWLCNGRCSSICVLELSAKLWDRTTFPRNVR